MVDHSFFLTNFGTKIGFVPLARKLKTWPGRKLCMVIYVPVALFSSKTLYSCKKSNLKFGVQMVVPVPVAPQGHFDGSFFRSLLYLRASASWNSHLVRLKLCASKGSAPSQLEAPFSVCCSIVRLRVSDCFDFVASILSFSSVLILDTASVLAVLTRCGF